MKKKKILLQCQSLTYLYLGLAAIYTMHPKRDVIVDVLFTLSAATQEAYGDKIYASKYPNKVFTFFPKELKQLHDKIPKKKNFKNKILFNFIYKKQIQNFINKKFEGNKYSEVYFSHEQPNLIITFTKMAFGHAKFIIYGDGTGLLFGANTKLINPYKKQYKFCFFNEIKPDKIVGLTPYVKDDSMDIDNVPIQATDPEILKDIIKNDEKIQSEINSYTEELLTTLGHCKKTLLLAANLNHKRFTMPENEQVDMFENIINKYCDNDSVLIVKGHPGQNFSIFETIQAKCAKNIKFIMLPKNIELYPIEIFEKLLTNVDNVIAFISSASISLKVIYNITSEDIYDIIQNYDLKHRVNYALKLYDSIIKKYDSWDKTSIIHKYNAVPEILEFYEKFNLDGTKKVIQNKPQG